jgi:hypothetical protein
MLLNCANNTRHYQRTSCAACMGGGCDCYCRVEMVVGFICAEKHDTHRMHPCATEPFDVQPAMSHRIVALLPYDMMIAIMRLQEQIATVYVPVWACVWYDAHSLPDTLLVVACNLLLLMMMMRYLTLHLESQSGTTGMDYRWSDYAINIPIGSILTSSGRSSRMCERRVSLMARACSISRWYCRSYTAYARVWVVVSVNTQITTLVLKPQHTVASVIRVGATDDALSSVPLLLLLLLVLLSCASGASDTING